MPVTSRSRRTSRYVAGWWSYAHKHDCVVEGELGHLVGAQFDEGEEGGNYSQNGHYTNPQQAADFVRQSGVDSLAVAIGNSHGAYKFKGDNI
jgi:fructose-bisphosphate aldolase class II